MVYTQKGLFPYKFSVKENLFYIGNTPDLSYYTNLSTSEYNQYCQDNWDFKQESVKYLEKDLISLHEILTKANQQVFLDYKINMVNTLTISCLALKIFLSSYYNNNIPNINKSSV